MGTLSTKKKIVIVGLGISILIVIVLSPFASSKPDGLERVAEDHGFAEKATGFLASWVTFFSDYTVAFIKNEKLSTIVAGICGVIMVFLVSYLLSKILKKPSA